MAESLYDDAQTIRVRIGENTIRICAGRWPAYDAAIDRTFILVHGNPAHLDQWRTTVAFLRKYGDVIALDNPGFGRSEAFVNDEPLLRQHAAVVIAAAEALGRNGPLDVVGHSHGGAIAQAVAARYRDRVRSLILIATAGYPAHLPYRLLPLRGVDRLVSRLGRTLVRRPLRPVMRGAAWLLASASYAPDPVPEGVAARESARLVSRPEILHTMVRVAYGDPCSQLWHDARKIRVPTLFIHGTRDLLVPIRCARALFEIVRLGAPRSRFEIMEGAGHMVHVTRAEAAHELITRWLHDIEQSEQAAAI